MEKCVFKFEVSERMRKSMLTVTLFILVTMLTGLVMNVQPTQMNHKMNTVRDGQLTQNAMNKIAENCNLSKENEEMDVSQNEECANASVSYKDANTQENISNSHLEELVGITPNQDTNTDILLPDGRIYWTQEPPYPYIPTVSPKEQGIPIIPFEPEN
jgi:hypothetical protein